MFRANCYVFLHMQNMLATLPYTMLPKATICAVYTLNIHKHMPCYSWGNRCCLLSIVEPLFSQNEVRSGGSDSLLLLHTTGVLILSVTAANTSQ